MQGETQQGLDFDWEGEIAKESYVPKKEERHREKDSQERELCIKKKIGMREQNVAAFKINN